MEFFIEYIAPNISTFLSLVATGTAGFLFGRKKINAEVAGMDADNEGKEIENADKLLSLYKITIDDLGSRYELKFKEVTIMYEMKVKLLEDEINLHKRIIIQLKEENTMLRNKIKDSGIVL